MNFLGRIVKGELRIRKLKEYIASLAGLEGREVVIEIEQNRHTRSKDQNNYYWGVVIHFMSEYTGFTPDEMHGIFGQMFRKETRTTKAGKPYEFIRSTTTMNTKEFADYVELCRMFAANEGVVIPDPEPQSKEPETPEDIPLIEPIILDEPQEPMPPDFLKIEKKSVIITRLNGEKKVYE